MDSPRSDRWRPTWWPGALLSLMAMLSGSGVFLAAAEAAPAPLNLQNRPTLGAETAAITIVEVSSFKCTHCRDFHEQTFPVLRRQYVDTGKVRWVMLNASDDPADQYGKAFAIARCAQRQGKYWKIAAELFRAGHRPPSFLEELMAANGSINRDELALCLRDRAVRTAVAEDFAEYAKLKLKGTPSFLVSKTSPDGRRIETVIAGAEKLEYFQRVIDELLKSP